MKVTRRCECGRSMTFVASIMRDRVALREQLVSFANGHEGCHIRMHPDAVPHRCGSCGLLLLFGDRCPFHTGSVREPWTVELGAAYRVVVDALAQGLTPSAPAALGAVYSQALRLANRWGNIEQGRAEVRAGKEQVS